MSKSVHMKAKIFSYNMKKKSGGGIYIQPRLKEVHARVHIQSELLYAYWSNMPKNHFPLFQDPKLINIKGLRQKKNRNTVLVLIIGELVWSGRLVVFICSPLICTLEELRQVSLCVSDIPKFDNTRELILLRHQRATEFDLMKQLEETTAALQITTKALEEEMVRTESILNMIVPPLVSAKLKRGEKVQDFFQEVTVMFSDVVRFTVIASHCTPLEVINMLNLLYMKFDARTEEYGVYKVETIGDAYMVVGGAPEWVWDHAVRVARLALSMVQEAHQVTDPVTNTPLQIRVGIHTGPVVAGCIGSKMPRYCLFGDTVNTASRMESHSHPDKIHVTQHT
ncbi:unnamed protein product, partial [Meganyctiphanes norvegica]